MIALTFDLETENNTLNKRKASPFDTRNYIVQIGWSVNGGKAHEEYYDHWHRGNVMPVDVLRKMGKGDVFIGFNIKFDMLWVWDEPEVQAALKRGATIYCGQYTEYLLGGHTQDVQMCAMNDIAEKYGGGCKIDAVKEMWQAGYLTSQIPKDLLTDYLIGDGDKIVGDVHNTWLIYCGQIKRMRAEHPKEFRTMLKFRMDGLLATCEMEYNGVHCDTVIGDELRNNLVIELEKATTELNTFVPKLPPELVFNWGSGTHKSCLIFGGVVKYEKWLAHTDDNGNVLYAKKNVKYPLFGNEPIPPGECIKAGSLYVREAPEGKGFQHKGKWYEAQDTYRSGKRVSEGKTKIVRVPDTTKPKGAKQPHYFKFDGYVKPHNSWKTEQTDGYGEPLYQTGAKIIKKLALRGLKFTDALVKHTGMDKDLGTYYWKENKKGERKGMLTLVNSKGIIHHKLNHTSTVTSRLSSSDPNLQNVPRGNTSNVKRTFTSRFGKDGRMAEIDYSQLEVVIQGVLSGDENLCRDLRNRVDFHCKRLAAKLGEEYEFVWDYCHVSKDTVELGAFEKWFAQIGNDSDTFKLATGTVLERGKIAFYKIGRTGAKIFSFQRAYGAGADTIANETGMPRSEVDALIAAEEKLYPMVAQFDKELEATINRNRLPSGQKLFLDGVAFTQGESHWDSPTGTRYVWREGITPVFLHKHGKYVGFSPTERKNYPMQGFGGEVVQTMLGLTFRYMLANDRFNGDVLLVNTVHDCVWLDGKADKIDKVALEIQKVLESVPEVFNTAYDTLDITVPFPCETEVGKDMFTMQGIH